LPLDELSIIDRFFRPLAGEGAFRLTDDAASLTVPEAFELVVTADLIAAGVHFLPDDPPDTVAQKALRVNLSDLAAKGAEPVAYLLGLGLGESTTEAWLKAFADGLHRDQQAFAVSLLGGDTIAGVITPVIAITAFGLVPKGRMVHRFGAKPDDCLYITGEIGASAAGLALLKNEPGAWDALGADERKHLVRRYRVPEPRVSLAPALMHHASAAMDVSDGLVGDCDKLCAASGCSAVLDARQIPLPAGLKAPPEDLLGRLLTAGDDYEILAAVPPHDEEPFRAAAREAGVPVTRVGRLNAGGHLTQVLVDGRPLPLHRRAYRHNESRPA
jgi:thiamine-monophosphate kinase